MALDGSKMDSAAVGQAVRTTLDECLSETLPLQDDTLRFLLRVESGVFVTKAEL